VLEASGLEALHLGGEYSGCIHLLLTDVVMPKINGRELAARLTSLRPEIKVLYMSGYTDDVIVDQGILQEDIAFLQKPFTPSSLVQKVRTVLDEA
jgi:DNA-binding NtrC family response regulator